jgi:hypothetical protein
MADHWAGLWQNVRASSLLRYLHMCQTQPLSSALLKAAGTLPLSCPLTVPAPQHSVRQGQTVAGTRLRCMPACTCRTTSLLSCAFHALLSVTAAFNHSCVLVYLPGERAELGTAAPPPHRRSPARLKPLHKPADAP